MNPLTVLHSVSFFSYYDETILVQEVEYTVAVE